MNVLVISTFVLLHVVDLHEASTTPSTGPTIIPGFILFPITDHPVLRGEIQHRVLFQCTFINQDFLEDFNIPNSMGFIFFRNQLFTELKPSLSTSLIRLIDINVHSLRSGSVVVNASMVMGTNTSMSDEQLKKAIAVAADATQLGSTDNILITVLHDTTTISGQDFSSLSTQLTTTNTGTRDTTVSSTLIPHSGMSSYSSETGTQITGKSELVVTSHDLSTSSTQSTMGNTGSSDTTVSSTSTPHSGMSSHSSETGTQMTGKSELVVTSHDLSTSSTQLTTGSTGSSDTTVPSTLTPHSGMSSYSSETRTQVTVSKELNTTLPDPSTSTTQPMTSSTGSSQTRDSIPQTTHSDSSIYVLETQVLLTTEIMPITDRPQPGDIQQIVQFGCRFTVQNYNDDLQNQKSPRFIKFRNDLFTGMQKYLLGQLIRLIDIIIHDLRSGSVVANMTIMTSSTTSKSDSQLSAAIIQAANSTSLGRISDSLVRIISNPYTTQKPKIPPDWAIAVIVVFGVIIIVAIIFIIAIVYLYKRRKKREISRYISNIYNENSSDHAMIIMKDWYSSHRSA